MDRLTDSVAVIGVTSLMDDLDLDRNIGVTSTIFPYFFFDREQILIFLPSTVADNVMLRENVTT